MMIDANQMNKEGRFNKTLKFSNKVLNEPIVSLPWFLQDRVIPSLNGWRAVAIIIVLLAHERFAADYSNIKFHWFSDKLIYGILGVQIFFVLSGFLITVLLIKEQIKHKRINIGSFFIRRIIRIFPVLYLYLITVLLLNNLLDLQLPINSLIGPLLYIHNFHFSPDNWIIGHTWSLSVEEQFYLIWPFLFQRQNKSVFIILLLLILIPIINIIVYKYPQYQNFLFAPFLQPASSIFCGALMAITIVKTHTLFDFRKLFHPVGLVLAILLMDMVYFFSQRAMLGKLLLPFGDTIVNVCICYAILYSLIIRNGYFYKLLNFKWMFFLGTISYSIYIWQQLFIIPKGTFPKIEIYSYYPINIVFAIGIAILSYYGFEKPFLNLKKKFNVKYE